MKLKAKLSSSTSLLLEDASSVEWDVLRLIEPKSRALQIRALLQIVKEDQHPPPRTDRESLWLERTEQCQTRGEPLLSPPRKKQQCAIEDPHPNAKLMWGTLTFKRM
eukprot:c20454_g1_i2 orf=260-580(-)